MAITIKSPSRSFVQFAESDAITSCNFESFSLCLPVYLDNDIAFQFVLQTDTSTEADDLCASNSAVIIGIAEDCSQEPLLNFSELPEKFRLSDRQVLYNWPHGLTDFASVISRGECFIIKVTVQGPYVFCSNCFQRISDPCHTSVIDYANDENAFGFNYCATSPVEGDVTADCAPTFVRFTDQSVLAIPYTASLQAKYGTMPTVQVWIYDPDHPTELVDMGIRVTFDAYPPTLMNFNFGGSASGVIKIS